MASYIKLELDTMPPKINIYLPPYTTNQSINEIIIESDESLSNYQDIYVIDSNGNRHDYNFEKTNDNQFEGIVKFSDLPIGIAVIYARMKDEVDNFSDIVSKSFVIKESLTLLYLDISNSQRDIKSIDVSRLVESKELIMEAKINENDRGVLNGGK